VFYDIASNLRGALANGSFIGFTGPAIEKTDANTQAILGDKILAAKSSAPPPTGPR